MRLARVKVVNFRLLESVEVGVDELVTLIVGRNNSGKTSFVNAFEKFFGRSDCRFVLEDLPTSRIDDIKRALRDYAKLRQEAEAAQDGGKELLQQALDLIPEIRLRLTIVYEEEDDLAPLSAAILDLDETCLAVTIEAVHRVTDKEGFLREADAALSRGAFTDDRYLRRYFSRYFKTEYYAVPSVGDESMRRELKRSTVREMIAVDFIYAQNKLDDSGMDSTQNLSKTFEAYYHANSAEETRNEHIDGLDDVLAAAAPQADKNLGNLFASVLKDVKDFGVRSIAPIQEPRIVTRLDAAAVLRGSTRVEYPSAVEGTALPEGHNGLGYSKLIFTILQIAWFYELFKRATPRPAIQLLFIEEPEAHLHPQMQETFIGNIRTFLLGKADWNVQVVITTHSSHIVAKSGFECVRYFDRLTSGARARDLLALQRKLESETDGKETLRFLKQYMALQRCDMFFADVIILIEGTVERLILPEMLRICAQGLQHAYVSIIEVGGAYAHRFKEILAFLEVPTLVITDIDSGRPTGKHAKCDPMTSGAVTTNSTLHSWLPGKKTIAELLASKTRSKVEDRVRVAYQIPETGGTRPGRSFEDAFILANADFLAAKTEELMTGFAFQDRAGTAFTAQQIASQAFTIAERLKDHKTDFAFDILQFKAGDWNVPRYIQEGLRWLLCQTHSRS